MISCRQEYSRGLIPGELRLFYLNIADKILLGKEAASGRIAAESASPCFEPAVCGAVKLGRRTKYS